jgi:signal peptidase I
MNIKLAKQSKRKNRDEFVLPFCLGKIAMSHPQSTLRPFTEYKVDSTRMTSTLIISPIKGDVVFLNKK